MAEVIQLYQTNFRDPVATLRRIADEMERGDFGEVGTIGVVVLGKAMQVFGAGPDSDGLSVALLLQAGNLRLVQSVEGYGK